MSGAIINLHGQPIQSSEPFKLYTTTDLHALRGKSKWILKRTIPDKSVGSIYGPSQSGKSFFSIDLLAHLTQAGHWHGRKINPRYVIYLPYEGVGSIPDRDLAWQRHHGRATGIHYILDRVNLRNAYQRGQMIEMFQRRGWWGAVFCIDTLAQAFAGIDENGSEMAEVLKVSQEISAALGATVIIVHHSGHSAQERPRGWSGFYAGLDFAIACARVEGHKFDRTFTFAKVKDGDDGDTHGFTLRAVVLDNEPDEDGDWSTSAVALPRAAGKADKRDTPDPMTDGEDDEFIWKWAAAERAKGDYPSMSSMRAQVKGMKEQRAGITVDRIRDAIHRLKTSSRLLEQGGEYKSPSGNTWLLAVESPKDMA